MHCVVYCACALSLLGRLSHAFYTHKCAMHGQHPRSDNCVPFWSVPRRWLDSIGMAKEADLALLKQKNITGSMLCEIGDTDLENFGLSARFERKRVIRALAALMSQAAVAAAATAATATAADTTQHWQPLQHWRRRRTRRARRWAAPLAWSCRVPPATRRKRMPPRYRPRRTGRPFVQCCAKKTTRASWPLSLQRHAQGPGAAARAPLKASISREWTCVEANVRLGRYLLDVCAI